MRPRPESPAGGARCDRRAGLMVLASAALCAHARPARAQATTWVATTYVPSVQMASYRGMEKFAAAVARETQGRLVIRMNVGGALPIPAANIAQAVADDMVQFGVDAFYTGTIPLAGIARLPMLLTSDADFAAAERVLLPEVERAYAAQGVVPLAHYSYPLQVTYSRRKLASLADIAGLKLRVSSPEQGEFVRRFGGSPVNIGPSDVPAALQSGAVDGAITATAGGGRIWRDHFKFNYRLGINYFDSYVIVNRAALEKLAPATRETLRRAARAAAAEISADLRTEEADVNRHNAAGGMTLVEPTAADSATATQRMTPYWDEWARGRDARTRDLLRQVRAAVGR